MPVSTEGSHRWLPERFLWQTVRRPALFRAAALADSRAGMAELVDALDSKSSGATRVGSTPTLGTNFLERRFGREGRGRAAFDAAAPSNAPTPTKTMSQIGICTAPRKTVARDDIRRSSNVLFWFLFERAAVARNRHRPIKRAS
jgi:hypothetical protein